MDRPIRIIVISDVNIYREGIIRQLNQTPHFNSFGVSSDQHLECESFTNTEVVLIDISYPKLLTTIDEIKTYDTDARLIVLNLFDLPTQVIGCAQRGVEAFVSKADGIQELIHCIHQVMEGRPHYNTDITQLLIKQLNHTETCHKNNTQLEQLTYRQSRVLELLESGKSNKEIAKSLGIEVATVKNHVHTILDKLSVQSRGEAAALFRRHQPAAVQI